MRKVITALLNGISNELEQEKNKHIESKQNLAELSQAFRKFKDNAEKNLQQKSKVIDELRHQAKVLEEENSKLKEQLRDDQSEIYNLQRRLGGHLTDERHSEDSSAKVFNACLEHLEQRSENESVKSELSDQQTSGRLCHTFTPEFDKIITALFEKLRSAADFFGRLLKCLNNNTQDADLIEKIRNMELDLNQSVEVYKRKMEELKSAPASIDSSFRNSEERTVPPTNKICTKCEVIESERDTLKAQLNNEISLKERYMEQAENSERNLRETRRRTEEIGGELRASQAKATEIGTKLNDIKSELQRKEDQIRVLRQQNLGLDAKNENILKAVQRLREIHEDELNGKEIELQRQYASIEYQEQRFRELEEQFMNEKEKSKSFESEMQRKEDLIKKYATKIKAFRLLLAQYGNYLDTSIEYENLVERSNQMLQDKLTDGQRSCFSGASNPATCNGAIHQSRNG